MKKLFYNLKFANSKLVWCIVTVFMMLSFAVKVDCSDGFKKSVITLPKAENGIEKIEYMVNGEPKGSTDGINSIELEPGAKINFAVKFQSDGYSQLRVRGVKINSENGSVLRLNTYGKDDEGNFVLMRVLDSELIDPNQTYISSDYVVGSKDDKFSFEGIEEDRYCVKIFDENNDVNLIDAVKLKYSENGGNYVGAEFSENENAFIINGITKSSNIKLMFEIREGYTNSNLSLVNEERQIAIDEASKICTLPELKGDANLEIRNLEKNSYNVTFNEYTNARFSCRIAGSDDEFTSSEAVKVNYGDSLEIKCETDSDDILNSGEVTANGKTIIANNGVYILESIKDNFNIAITPKGSALYTISLPENENRIKLCDTSGNEISEISTTQNDSVDFKIVPGDAYKKNFIVAEMYAVPVSKLSNGGYDIKANPEEAKSFLMLPSGDYAYTLKNVTEPVKIIATGMEKSVYTVTLPEKIIGASAEVETNENVTQLTENKFKVVHGSDLVVNLEAEPGYDLSTIKATDVDNSLEVTKDGNKYTFKNINNDKYLIINGASTALCKVSFDGKNIVGTSESGTAWKDNTASIKYQEGILKFKVRPADEVGDSDEDISLSIKSGSGKLEKVSAEKNTYLLSGVTGDIVLSAANAQSSDVTITLKSDDEDLQFTDANDENIILPEENTVKYGTDLNFKVVSKSGKSTDNASVMSSVSNPIVASDTSSNTYSVKALRSGATLANTRAENNLKSGHYVDVCKKLHVGSETYPLNGDTAWFTIPLYRGEYGGTVPKMFLIFSKDPEACESINRDTIYTTPSDSWDDNGFNLPFDNFQYEDNNKSLLLNIPPLSSDSETWNIPISMVLNKYENNDSIPASLSAIDRVLPASNYTGGAVSDRSVRNISNPDAALPTPILSETNAGDYCDVRKNQGPNDADLLVYLQDCYCHVFQKFYPYVKFDTEKIKRDDLTFRPLEPNIINDNDTYKVKTDWYSDEGISDVGYASSGENYSFASTPTTTKFRLSLDDSKKFKDDIATPIRLNEGAHAKILNQTVSNDRSYVECELMVTPFDEKIELNWSSPEAPIEVRQYKATFVPKSNSSVFRDDQGAEKYSVEVSYKNGLTFFTEPAEGHTFSDSLRIEVNSKTYTVDEISKITVGKEHYNGEWIRLDGSNDEPEMFIRGIQEDSRIRYEIAGKDSKTGTTERITEYIYRSDNQENAQPGTIIYDKYTDKDIIPKGLMDDLTITSERSLIKLSVTFSYAEGIEYWPNSGNEPFSSEPQLVNYGEALVFKVKAKDGYDISGIQVMASTDKNTHILNLTNDVYVIAKVTDQTTVLVNGIEKSNISLSFEQYEGITYKTSSGGEYLLRQQVPYNEEIAFQVDVAEGYSQSAKSIDVFLNYPNGTESPLEFKDSPSTDPEHPCPYIQNNLYIIPANCVNQDMKITIQGLKPNEYSVSLTSAQGITYINSSGEGKLPVYPPDSNNGIAYGNSFKFRLNAEEGYDISNVEVVAKAESGNSSPITLIPANGVYTIENITSNYTVTVSGIAKQQHTIEFRTVTGVACLDGYGKTLPSSVTVADGGSYSFYLSFDSAYSKSKDTADVTIKGSNNKVPRDSSGKYTLSNITEDKIVEIINVTKNSYTATFVPAEGVVYRTAKGKEFEGTQNVEYGESLYFKLSLLDAYDQSIPNVKMNGTKNLVENSGSYVLENISDDVTVTVENVKKNPEELTIEDIQNVPDPVTNEDDVNAVVAATKAYNSLSDEDKKLVTNKQALEKAQSEAGDINHTSNGVSISGVDWNVKLIVTPLSDNPDEMKAFEEKVDRRSVLSLYRAELIDLLTGESYSVPYGQEVQITIPCPDLTGYKNVTVAHENLAENMEYLDPNIVDGTAKFSATSLGLFGIAAKEIPNYSESTSDMSISMGDLVSDDEELKTLLGEDLSSQLGHLIDLEDENSNNGGDSNKNGNGGSDGSDGSDSLMNDMAGGAASLANSVYNWALDNEFLAVMGILALGSFLILIILLTNRKKDKGNKDDNLKKRKQ